MEYVILPHTDLTISRIGLGCEPLGGTDWGKVDETEAMAAVARACDLGINLFDTANVYGLGRSEELLSRALGTHRHEMVIVTKFGVNWHRVENGERARTFLDASPRHAVEALHGSLRRLRLDCIPLYLVHWPDPQTPIADTLEVLRRCRESGKIRYIGVSNFPANLIREAYEIERLAVVELPYNLINRSIEDDIIPCCLELGISILAYSPLAQGLLTGKYSADTTFSIDDRRHRLPHFQGNEFVDNLRVVDRLCTIGLKYRRSESQTAIRWVLDAPGITGAIVGAKTPAQIEENAGAMGWRIDEQDWQYLAHKDLSNYGRCLEKG